jgi:hypothetical protein
VKLLRLVLLSLVFLGTANVANSQPNGRDSSRLRCFFASQFENWKAPDAKTIYVRVGTHRYYRLDLAGRCQTLTRPGAFLITKLHASTSICSALDWDLHVTTSWRGIPQVCIVKKMVEVTPDEIALLPKRFRP